MKAIHHLLPLAAVTISGLAACTSQQAQVDTQTFITVREWKIQVLENRKEFVVTMPLDRGADEHFITLTIVDPGQIIQKITVKP